MRHLSLILLVVAINVLAQLTFKQAMLTHGEITLGLKALPAFVIRLFTTPMVVIGSFLYGVGPFL